MKKRNLLRIISLILMVGMLFSTASAASQVQPRYVKIHTLTSELFGFNWLGKTTVCGTVTVLDKTCDVYLYVDLQQSEDGVNGWTTIKTWSATGNGDVVIEESYYVTSGYYYRAITTAIIYDAEGYFIESDMASSAVLYY